MYARAFAESGCTDLESIGRLSEADTIDLADRFRVHPGHRLRLLRAVGSLRHAVMGGSRQPSGRGHEDLANLERLSAQNEELSKAKNEMDSENARLCAENRKLLQVVREQDDELQRADQRIVEMEEMLQAQTEQVQFLTYQLQCVAEESEHRQDDLFQSYREAFDDTHADWAEAERLQLPEITSAPGEDMAKMRAFTPEDFARAAEVAARAIKAPGSAPGQTRRGGEFGCLRPSGATSGQQFSPPHRAKHAQTLDSAQVFECLAGFDVDHIIRCLATAVLNKIILSVGKSRPHGAPAERIERCSIFLEPSCLERLQKEYENRLQQTQSIELRDTLGKPLDPLNAVAVRSVPGMWDVYAFLRDIMVNFRLEPEVSVITLIYLDRFSELSGLALTPDNWRRLVITAMMLASKVWNDESFENIEFSQLCPFYTLDEINAFERVFLNCVGYNMSVKGSQYAKTYFLLRTLGAKDSPDFKLEPLDGAKATRLAERCLEKQIQFRAQYPEELVQDGLGWTM